MNIENKLDLIDLFRAFLAHHPSMRFGQALCGAASWEDEDPSRISDELLASSIQAHLEGNFGDDAYTTGASSLPDDLASALREMRVAETTPLGSLVCRLARTFGINPYDIENEQLLDVIRTELAALQGSAAR